SGLRGEPVTRQLHTVAGVAGEPDDHAIHLHDLFGHEGNPFPWYTSILGRAVGPPRPTPPASVKIARVRTPPWPAGPAPYTARDRARGFSEADVHDYFRAWAVVALLGLVGVAFVVAVMGANRLLSPSRPTHEKLLTYECGVDPVGEGWAQMHVRYYVFAYL